MSTLRRIARQVAQTSQEPAQRAVEELSWRKTLSTGSTLLDKAISGLKTFFGGLPGGILVEIYGDSGTGKTTILAEIVGNAQREGGETKFGDPEARLDPDYCKLMGVKYEDVTFSYPDTITEVEESIIGPLVTKSGKESRDTSKAWTPDPEHINVLAEDSLAALCSKMEVAQGDKMGQRRAKDFSQMFRMVTRHLKKHNILMVCSNQIRDVVDHQGYGPKTKSSGGHAIKFYSSIRIELRFAGRIKKGDRPVGKMVEATIVKSSLDTEWRTAPIRLLFGYGIDDIGANLQWLKDNGAFDEEGKKASGYIVANKKYQSLDNAIAAVEERNLEPEIKKQVCKLWDKLENEVQPKRKEKMR